MAYYTNVGPDSGAILWNNALFAVSVVEEPGSKTPIGMALAVSWTADLVALWELIIDEVELSGLWIVVDREFMPVHWDGRRTGVVDRQRLRATV